ncbi:MAG: hypothetical protein ACE5E8_10420 [Acidimicrobiia bacterium]
MVPLRESSLDDSGSDRLSVLVPGVLGAGLLMSVGIMIADVFRSIAGDTPGRRRRLLGAHATAEAVLTGSPGQGMDGAGLRSRRTYVIAALAGIGIGGYGVSFSFWNYVLKDHMWSAIGWILALSATVGVALIWVGVAAGLVALRWPYVPAFSWPMVLRTPLGRAPGED